MPAPSAYARRQFPGAAADTTITADINNSDTSCTLAATTGWPDGSYTGGVLCEFYSTATGMTAEKVFATGRAGSTLEIVRAQDQTSATGHAAGTGIRPAAGAIDADEANRAVSETIGVVTTAGDLLVADGANSFTRLAKGSDGEGLFMVAGNLDWSGVPANSVGNSQLQDDAVDSPEIADGAIDLVHMSANSVDSDQYVDGSIDTVHIGDDQITLAKLAASAKARWSVPFFANGNGGNLFGASGNDALTCSTTPTGEFDEPSAYVCPEAGAIIGISVGLSDARTNGSAVFEVHKGGVGTGLTVTLNGSNTQYHYGTQSETSDSVAAGNLITVVATPTGFLPSAGNVAAVHVHFQAV